MTDGIFGLTSEVTHTRKTFQLMGTLSAVIERALHFEIFASSYSEIIQLFFFQVNGKHS